MQQQYVVHAHTLFHSCPISMRSEQQLLLYGVEISERWMLGKAWARDSYNGNLPTLLHIIASSCPQVRQKTTQRCMHACIKYGGHAWHDITPGRKRGHVYSFNRNTGTNSAAVYLFHSILSPPHCKSVLKNCCTCCFKTACINFLPLFFQCINLFTYMHNTNHALHTYIIPNMP